MPAGTCSGSDIYERKLSVLTVRVRAAVTYDGRREVLSWTARCRVIRPAQCAPRAPQQFQQRGYVQCERQHTM